MKKEKHPFKNLYYRHLCKGQYIVNGSMTGNIEHCNSIVIGSHGVIHGNVHAKYADIDGTIHGDLIIEDYVELSSSATITGQLQATEIIHKDALTVPGSTTDNSAK